MIVSRRVRPPLPCLALACLLVLHGCRIGGSGNPAASSVATSPHGATVRIDWRGTGAQFWEDEGELIAVSDSGLFLLHRSQLVLYPTGSPARIRPLDAPGTSMVDLREAPTAEELDDLRDYARYPFGLDDRSMRRLLEAMGRDSVLVRRIP